MSSSRRSTPPSLMITAHIIYRKHAAGHCSYMNSQPVGGSRIVLKVHRRAEAHLRAHTHSHAHANTYTYALTDTSGHTHSHMHLLCLSVCLYTGADLSFSAEQLAARMATRQEHESLLDLQQELQHAAAAASLPPLRARNLRQVRQEEAPRRPPQIRLPRSCARVRVMPRGVHTI